jgi:hypothetical protein
MLRVPVVYKILLFIYVLAIPFYGTYFIPLVRTVVLIPILFIPFVDKRKRYLPLLKVDAIRWFAVFVAFCTITSIFVAVFDLAVDQFLDYLVDLVFLVSFLIIASSSSSLLKIVFYALVIGLALSVALGFLEHHSVNSFKIQDDDSINTNILNGGMTRIGGPFGNSLTYSNYLSVAGIIVIVIFLKQKTTNFTVVALIVYLLTTVVLVFSGGRSAIVAFQLAFAIAFFIYIKNKWIMVGAVALFLFVGITYSDKILKIPTVSRFFDSSNDLKDVRYENNWAYGFKIVGESPLIGTGMGNLNYKLVEMRHPYVPASRKFKHNGHLESVFVTVMATYGLIGLALFLTWIIIVTYKMIRGFSTFRGTVYSGYLAACFFG